MRRLSALLVLLMLGGVLSPAVAEDLFPPTLWDRYSPGTSFQQWEFSTGASQNVLPDFADFAFGQPTIQVYPVGSWQEYWGVGAGERHGVWPLSGVILADIPNSDNDEDPYKKWIQIQLTWAGEVKHPDAEPCVSVMATGLVEKVSETTVELLDPVTNNPLPTGVPLAGEYWYHTTYLYKVTPNPTEETIMIGGSIMVDELVVDTICTEQEVPEPTTLGLLFVGGVGLLLRRFRK
ncbi:MAG: PEP-CTERM sorting domain-containing protein [Phycisphaerae bacterium]|nr:PEP-CTERM sorting domain-containing protein [Phycisphaerae bacterium]